MTGQTDWFDLPVTDLADAMSFYEGLLHWTYRQMDQSPEMDYVMIEAEGKLIGGLRKVTADPARGTSSPLSPILYFNVPDLAASATRAKELGAHLSGPIVDLGHGRGRYQWIRDRSGLLVGLWAKA